MAVDNTLLNYCLINMSNTPKQTIQGFCFDLSRTCTNNGYDLVYEFYWFPLKVLI